MKTYQYAVSKLMSLRVNPIYPPGNNSARKEKQTPMLIETFTLWRLKRLLPVTQHSEQPRCPFIGPFV